MAKVLEAMQYLPWMPKASWLLVCARLGLRRISPKQIRDGNEYLALRAPSTSVPSLAKQRHIIKRVNFVIPRLARVLPWRADCLVQAMAGQRWLSSEGIISNVEIGVSHTEADGFRAHAWLVHDGKTILGGDIEAFSALLSQGKGKDAVD